MCISTGPAHLRWCNDHTPGSRYARRAWQWRGVICAMLGDEAGTGSDLRMQEWYARNPLRRWRVRGRRETREVEEWLKCSPGHVHAWEAGLAVPDAANDTGRFVVLLSRMSGAQARDYAARTASTLAQDPRAEGAFGVDRLAVRTARTSYPGDGDTAKMLLEHLDVLLAATVAKIDAYGAHAEMNPA